VSEMSTGEMVEAIWLGEAANYEDVLSASKSISRKPRMVSHGLKGVESGSAQ
jgi:hypothetical protein